MLRLSRWWSHLVHSSHYEPVIEEFSGTYPLKKQSTSTTGVIKGIITGKSSKSNWDEFRVVLRCLSLNPTQAEISEMMTESVPGRSGRGAWR